MEKARVWREKIIIPTYEIGEAEKNPIFLEKRVYQGSSGKVYPYPTVEKISDVKTDKEYSAVFLENEYLKVMILPELGGRIQRAYDKTNGYDFVYYNHVIKPALVGLTGPWISGGIEFNWPQHHRPTTFMPTDSVITENSDGSCSVLINDFDRLYGTKGIAKLTLRPGKAYIEISGQLYNGTPFPQTFLWWANPAVAVNDDTQSIFPPDVHAVMDHGKRDVSRFPIATGVYYKKDYSEGVDISRYRNIPVPTSYMAEKSNYDFVGGYDYGKEAGILHIADHHISPGKKQWTWGCGDFGKAWDRNLTDSDGPYVELMTGVFTDNQPDFTWLKPFEEKTFTQYFMPYKAVGQVKNASVDAAVNLEFTESGAEITVYATSSFDSVIIRLEKDGEAVFSETAAVSPTAVYRRRAALSDTADKTGYLLVVESEGRTLVSYRPEPETIPEIPEPANAAKKPEEIQTNEELYLTALHIEQYRHATFLPDPYYLEGLKRDPSDIRINNAYGNLLMRRGLFSEAQKHFEKALVRLTERNPNPLNGETFFNLGLALMLQGKTDEAYDRFYKATWSAEQQESGFFFLALIDSRNGRFEKAYRHIEKALTRNTRNIKARGLRAYLLRKAGKYEEALQAIAENLETDPFDFVSVNEKLILSGAEDRSELTQLMRGYIENHLNTAIEYASFCAYSEAIGVLRLCPAVYPLIGYYEAHYQSLMGLDPSEALEKAENASPDYCFPNRLEDIPVLEFAISAIPGSMANYYLGNLFYDKLQYDRAGELWKTAAAAHPSFPTVHRNLALYYYNKKKDQAAALCSLETAFGLDPSDVRIFLELDQLRKKIGMSFEDRLDEFRAHIGLADKRDDLYIEYITLLNLTGRHNEAYSAIMSHHFHPWEGGEGKVTAQYVLALCALAKRAENDGEPEKAEKLLRDALVFPENLGEGKLEGSRDNDVYYALGQVLRKQGRDAEATRCFELATLGTVEPAGVMYYNDQPADRILYQGLAFLALGNRAEANRRFYRLLDYGERHLNDQVSIDYFAVSLPDFLIFEDDYTRRNRAHCCYLMALAHYGLGDTGKALDFLSQVEEIEPSHMMCRVYKNRFSGERCR